MTITCPIRLLLVGPFGGLVAAMALGGAGCTTYPSPPSQPAFDTDVLPIFQAHCTRCHGNGPDGGTLNNAGVPGVTYNAAGPPVVSPPYLSQFGDTCLPLSDGTPGTCQNNFLNCRCGAHDYAVDGMIKTYIDPGYSLRMPPPPAPPLNDWELKVVNAWVDNPVCSNSPNPDPAICPGP
jgi:hypothetical protein